MDITLERGGGRHLIRGYEHGHIIVNDKHYVRSLIVTPERLISEWPPQALAELREVHLETIIGLRPEVVLLGTGAHLIFPAPKIMAYFGQRAIGLEAMDTAAACRTYNVLMSEGRAVAAALLVD
jgi:uncharacterized protein